MAFQALKNKQYSIPRSKGIGGKPLPGVEDRVLSIRYYEHLHKSYHISWSYITDKSGTVPLETQ